MSKQFDNTQIRVVYLAGSGHSGSTLLDMILSAHSKIFGIGELYTLTMNRDFIPVCTCGDSFNECPFWSSVPPIIKGYDLDIGRKFFNLLLNKPIYYKKDDKFSEVIDKNDYVAKRFAIYSKLLDSADASYVFDSSKDINQAEPLLDDPRVNVLLVHLVRDGRGVVWSYMKKNRTFLTALRHWLFTNLKIEIVKLRNRNSFVTIRYEDLVRDPEDTIKKILTRLGLSFESKMLRFNECSQHQLSGNRMRFSGSSEIAEDLSWRNDMPINFKILFFFLGGWMNFYYRVFD